MKLERVAGAACGPPFPVYSDLAASLATAHPPSAAARRDPLVAHVLGTLAGYAYADADTVATPGPLAARPRGQLRHRPGGRPAGRGFRGIVPVYGDSRSTRLGGAGVARLA
jgi:hypothetical protein